MLEYDENGCVILAAYMKWILELLQHLVSKLCVLC